MNRTVFQKNPDIVVRLFQREHQEIVKKLILAGLTEHWGSCDPTLNPDLNDIAAHYASATFLVAWCGEQIVGTGALVPKTDTVAEIVRMSVASDRRRQGIATTILEHLCQEAANQGYQRLILETTATWHGVIAFYRNFGFNITHEQEGKFGRDVYFSLDLSSEYFSHHKGTEYTKEAQRC